MKKVFVLILVTVLLNSLTACSSESNKIEFYKGEPSLYMMSSPDKNQGRAYAVFMENTVAMAYGSRTEIFGYSNDDSSITLINNGEEKKLSLKVDEKNNDIQVFDPDNSNELVYSFHLVRQNCKQRMISDISEISNYFFISSDDGISNLLISDGKFHVSRSGRSVMEANYTLEGNNLNLTFKRSNEVVKIRVEPLDSYDFVLYDVNDDKNFIILHAVFAGGEPICNK